MIGRPLIYAHIGELHLIGPDERNAFDLAAITAEVTAFGDALDFVHLPGDNADNGRPIGAPWRSGCWRRSRCPFTSSPATTTWRAAASMPLTVARACRDGPTLRRRRRALPPPGRLRTGAGRPRLPPRSGSTPLAERRAEGGGRSATPPRDFACACPADLCDEGETDRLDRARGGRGALLADMGHAHTDEFANDGRTIVAATRSTGQIEEGPVGDDVFVSIASVARGLRVGARPPTAARARSRSSSRARRTLLASCSGAGGAWPERDVLGAQFGPNRNGRHW